MNILEIISGKSINGACVYCSLLIKELVKRGHQITLAAPPESWIWEQVSELPIQRIESTLQRIPPGELRRLATHIQKNNIDVIHTHMSRAHTIGIFLKWMTGAKCVATAHNRYFQLHWRFNDFVIANSEATRKYHCRVNGVNPRRTATIPCFVDLKRFSSVPERLHWVGRRQVRSGDDEPLLGVIGEVTERKGQIHLFRTLPRLLQSHPDLKLAVIGRYDKTRPYDKQLRSFLMRNGLYRKVIWAYERDHIEKIIAALDVCVVPSIEEPQGMVALEAMAAGTPVVATRVGGLPEMIQDGFNGLLVEPRNEEQLADAILKVLGDPELGSRLAQNASQWVASEYAPEKLTAQVEATFDSLVVKRQAA